MSDALDRVLGRPSVVAAVRLVRDLTLQLKSAQRLSGKSGQLGYAIDSIQAWDYDQAIAYTNTTYDLGLWRIIYTGDGTQDFPIAVPQFDVRINGTGEGNRMKVDPSNGDYEYDDAAVNIMAFDYGKLDPDFFDSPTQGAWILRLFYIGKTAPGSFRLRIKARAQATSGGTFSVVRIA